MKPSPDVLAALNAVYPLLLTLKEQSHRQENVYEAARYKGLKAWFDKLTHVVQHCLLHHLVDWFAEHHAEQDSRLEDVQVAEANKPDDAFKFTLALLHETYQAYLAVLVILGNDPPTMKLAHNAVCKLEHWIDKAEAELQQIDDLDADLYLQSMKHRFRCKCRRKRKN